MQEFAVFTERRERDESLCEGTATALWKKNGAASLILSAGGGKGYAGDRERMPNA
jgi:hypothetical protein